MLIIIVNNLLARVYQAQLCILRVINKINKICYAAKLFGTTSKKKSTWTIHKRLNYNFLAFNQNNRSNPTNINVLHRVEFLLLCDKFKQIKR